MARWSEGLVDTWWPIRPHGQGTTNKHATKKVLNMTAQQDYHHVMSTSCLHTVLTAATHHTLQPVTPCCRPFWQTCIHLHCCHCCCSFIGPPQCSCRYYLWGPCCCHCYPDPTPTSVAAGLTRGMGALMLLRLLPPSPPHTPTSVAAGRS
jgi:hypothetical protein